MTFDPAVNQETGVSSRRYRRYHLDLWTGWNRCDCDAHGKQVGVKQLYNPVPMTVRESWSQLVGVRVAVWGRENQLPAEGLGPLDPRLSNPAEWERSAAKDRGICCSLFSLQLTSRTYGATLSWIKCERYIFLKNCVRLFIEVRILCWLCFRVSLYIYYVAIQQTFHAVFIVFFHISYNNFSFFWQVQINQLLVCFSLHHEFESDLFATLKHRSVR